MQQKRPSSLNIGLLVILCAIVYKLYFASKFLDFSPSLFKKVLPFYCNNVFALSCFNSQWYKTWVFSGVLRQGEGGGRGVILNTCWTTWKGIKCIKKSSWNYKHLNTIWKFCVFNALYSYIFIFNSFCLKINWFSTWHLLTIIFIISFILKKSTYSMNVFCNVLLYPIKWKGAKKIMCWKFFTNRASIWAEIQI